MIMSKRENSFYTNRRLIFVRIRNFKYLRMCAYYIYFYYFYYYYYILLIYHTRNNHKSGQIKYDQRANGLDNGGRIVLKKFKLI